MGLSQRPTTLIAIACALLGCSRKIPDRWAALGIPTDGLERVGDATNEDRFLADYRGFGNQRGSDPMLYGICFEGYELGPAERVK